ncbi:uncharacterized protein LOC129720338 [Wyeomyia smithii]|uniref:uncharacterized protein LOC129720338 n=1 Tax=Wyeomyia smithii TaxID=174621 RepID=UPI002467BA8E|nr:uncharacterized protein LOC129720338 [Wyeomyia smithii]
MAPLPAARLASFERPFTHVGVDFFGPVTVKIGRSHAKRWVALFTCLTIRAVHLEIAYSLSTDSCISCFRRFVGRRGAPLEVYSDNGTNFVGAERVLMRQIKSDMAEAFTNANTKWLFNPPSAPHMGGVWERMVRSVKAAIESIDTGRKLNDEGFLTLLIEAESNEEIEDLETFLELNERDYSRLQLTTKMIKTIEKLQAQFREKPEDCKEHEEWVEEVSNNDSEYCQENAVSWDADNPYHGISLEEVSI